MPRRLARAAVAATTMVLVPAAAAGQADLDDPHDLAAYLGGRGGRSMISAVVEVRGGSAGQPTRLGRSQGEAPEAHGGGAGGESACRWVPVGPIAEVAAAQAAINAGQQPEVDDPSVPGALAPVPGVYEGAARTDWYRVTGTTAEVLHRQVCNGATTSLRWLPLRPDATGTLTVQVRAQDLVPGARDEVLRRLPTPRPRIGPADEDPNGWSYVNNRTFFWIDDAPGQWHPVTATASAGGITVTVTAEPVSMRVDPGDGSAPFTCEGTPPPVTRADFRPDIEGCSHTYRDSSAMAPNGQTWPVTVGIVWHATWTATTGEGGDLGYVATTSPTRELPVAEIQAIVTRADN